MQTPLRKDLETPLRGVRSNIVQSIRAYRIPDLQAAAETLGAHFLSCTTSPQCWFAVAPPGRCIRGAR